MTVVTILRSILHQVGLGHTTRYQARYRIAPFILRELQFLAVCIFSDDSHSFDPSASANISFYGK
jgi:hypothetical protein